MGLPCLDELFLISEDMIWPRYLDFFEKLILYLQTCDTLQKVPFTKPNYSKKTLAAEGDFQTWDCHQWHGDVQSGSCFQGWNKVQLPVATFFLGGKRGEKKDSLLLGLNVSFQKLVGVKSLTFFDVFLVGVELWNFPIAPLHAFNPVDLLTDHGRMVRAPPDRQLHSLNFNEGQLEGCRHTRCVGKHWR